LPEDRVTSVAVEDSIIWIGTNRRGLVKFNGVSWTVYDTSNSDLPYGEIRSIAIDGGGAKWIATFGGGLAKFDGISWTVYDVSNSDLPNDYLQSVAIDLNGDKWVATYGGGAAKFDDTSWTVYNTVLPDNYLQSITIDKDGNKWVGTLRGGLAKYNDINWTVFNTSNSGLPHKNVMSLSADEKGNLWIGTSGGGLAVYREGGVIVNIEKDEFNNYPIKQFELQQNYPNPFNPQTTIRYNLIKNEKVTIEIYNICGQKIKTLVDQQKSAGKHSVVWDGKDAENRKLPSGVYFYRCITGASSITKKLVLVK
jgi:ligand-binding sensor domain-containing protein